MVSPRNTGASSSFGRAQRLSASARSLVEETALSSKFFVPKEQKVTNPGRELLLLHATVEELVRCHA